MRLAAHARSLMLDDRAQAVTEYGVLVGVFALGLIGVLIATGDRCRWVLQIMDRRLGGVGG